MMTAVIFEEVGKEPVLAEAPEPVVQHGDVVVDVIAAPVLPYHHEVFSGRRPMLFELPFVPGTGAVGQMRAIGSGATQLQLGAWVYCDPTLRARHADGLPAISLQGLTANGPTALPIQRQYRHGSWATQLSLPLENVVPLGNVDAASAPRWLTIATMLVPFGGLDGVGLKPARWWWSMERPARSSARPWRSR